MPPVIDRPGFTGTGSGVGATRALERYYTQMLQANPAFRPPQGYKIQNGQVIRDTQRGIDLAGKIAGGAGVGLIGYGGGQLLAGALGAGGGGAAGASTGGTAAAGGAQGAATATGGSMGWLDTLRNVLGIAGRVGSVAGDIAGSRGDAMANAEGAQLTRDRLNLDRAHYQDQSYMDRADVDLNRRNFELNAPASRTNTGVRASMLSNLQSRGARGPQTMSSGRVVNPINFGTDPSALIGGDARGLGSEVMKQIMAQQAKGDQFDPIPKVDYPTPQGAPQSGILDKVLNVGAAVGGVAGAIPNPPVNQARRRKPTPPVTPDPYDPEL